MYVHMHVEESVSRLFFMTALDDDNVRFHEIFGK